MHLYEYEYSGGDVVRAAKHCIVILEDNGERATEMRKALAELRPDIDITVFDDALKPHP